ncbi:hypothetical protein V8F33_006434 [Rhypophila sp. PSN 637]
MDSDRRRFLSNQNQRELYRYSQQYGYREIYPAYYSYENLWDRLKSPAFILSALCLVLAVLYQLGLQQGRIRPVPGIVWDLVVSITPARLLYFVDSWVNPPFFPRPQDPVPLPCDDAAKSELLKKILGINTNATPSNAISSWINSFVTMPLRPGPPGLTNPRFYCFRNSVIQSLATWNPYIEYLDKSAASHLAGESTRPRTLCDLLNCLRGKSTRTSSMPVPKTIAFIDRFDSWSQHDAHEYYLHLINSIDEDLKSVKSKSPRSDKNPVEGLIADRISCTTCGHYDSIRLNPFKTLDLALDSKQVPQSLSSCLDRYTTLEPYTDINCNYCTLVETQKALAETADEETKKLLSKVTQALEDGKLDDAFIGSLVKSNNLKMQRRTKMKQMAIARPPKLLAIHIERSIYSFSGAQAKNRAKLVVPLELDLGPWVLGSAEKAKEKGDASGAEEWILDPHSSMVARSKGRSRLLGPKYRLTAIVFHKGYALNSGHYLVLRNYEPPPSPEEDDGSTKAEEKPGPPTWFLVSDENVDPIESTLEKAIENRPEDVHMLFYEYIDPKPVLNEDEPESATMAPLPECTKDTTEVPNTESSKTVGEDEEEDEEERASSKIVGEDEEEEEKRASSKQLGNKMRRRKKKRASSKI